MAPARPEIAIVPATFEHAREMAPRMREADAREVLAHSGRSPLSALQQAVACSDIAKAALFDGQVAALFGVATLQLESVLLGPRIGSIWMLTSDLVERYPKAFHRAARRELDALHASGWPLLVNAIDARHEQALRWARRIGFRVGDPIPYGVEKLPFHPIRRWVDGVAAR